MQKDDGGEYSTLLLTVSPEFSMYVSNENSVFLIESLRRTFYDRRETRLSFFYADRQKGATTMTKPREKPRLAKRRD